MKTKLTLSLNDTIVAKAKEFARNNHTSLSRLFEDFLMDLTSKGAETTDKAQETSPLVKSLSGVITLPENFDYREDRSKYLESKYK